MLNLCQVVCPLNSMSTCMSSLCPVGLTTCHLLFIYLYILLIAIWITGDVQVVCPLNSMSTWLHLDSSMHSHAYSAYIAYCYLDVESMSSCMSTKLYVHLGTSG